MIESPSTSSPAYHRIYINQVVGCGIGPPPPNPLVAICGFGTPLYARYDLQPCS
jgi:hypothetical protein